MHPRRSALVLMTMVSLLPVASVAYHIDSPWVRVDAATGQNLTCVDAARFGVAAGDDSRQPGHNRGGFPPDRDRAGTDCNDRARGWVIGAINTGAACKVMEPPSPVGRMTARPDDSPGTVCRPEGGTGIFVACEDNMPSGDEFGSGSPGINGLCSASNVKFSRQATQDGDGTVEVCGDPTAGTVTYGAGTDEEVACGPSVTPPGSNEWTRFYIFSSRNKFWTDTTPSHPDEGPIGCSNGAALGGQFRVQDPHDDAGRHVDLGGNLVAGGESYDPGQDGNRCIPDHGDVAGFLRVGSNAHALTLSTKNRPHNDPGGTTNPAFDVPAGSIGLVGNYGSSRTFFYRELVAYWVADGHVTFFIDLQPEVLGFDPGSPTKPLTGSYWAEDCPTSAAPVGNPFATQTMMINDYSASKCTTAGTPPLGTQVTHRERVQAGFGCNSLYDTHAQGARDADGDEGVLKPPGNKAYFDPFNPLTYWTDTAAAAMPGGNPADNGGGGGSGLSAAQTVCRAP